MARKEGKVKDFNTYELSGTTRVHTGCQSKGIDVTYRNVEIF
jgi:hypothetical protein